MLTSAMLVGAAFGVLIGLASTALLVLTIRPAVAIALVVGVPTVLGLALVFFTGRRWGTTLGAFVVSIAPGWFGVLVATQAVTGG